MLDCGIHPGYAGKASLPYFDEIEMEDVDAMLVTHFHLDHCAAVPYVTAQTPFKARQQGFLQAVEVLQRWRSN